MSPESNVIPINRAATQDQAEIASPVPITPDEVMSVSDIVPVDSAGRAHRGIRKTDEHWSDSRYVSNYEVSQIAEHQDEIRNNPPEARVPAIDDPTDVLTPLPEPQESNLELLSLMQMGYGVNMATLLIETGREQGLHNVSDVEAFLAQKRAEPNEKLDALLDEKFGKPGEWRSRPRPTVDQPKRSMREQAREKISTALAKTKKIGSLALDKTVDVTVDTFQKAANARDRAIDKAVSSAIRLAEASEPQREKLVLARDRYIGYLMLNNITLDRQNVILSLIKADMQPQGKSHKKRR